MTGAGIAVAATHRTMTDTGNVAIVGSLASFEPMMPPSVTMTIAPVAEISWQQVRITMFLNGIPRALLQSVAFSHILVVGPTHVED